AMKMEHQILAPRDGRVVAELMPKLNFYPTQREPVGTPDVQTIGYEDVYLSLMSFEQDGSRVAVKAFVVPMVAWIWWSLPIIVFGSLVTLWPRRQARRTAPEGAKVSVT
ncbi:MAG: cytochrome c-type biogenesis CcmF C-terminal domain-containing protein, partial [Myxococcota bacterium]